MSARHVDSTAPERTRTLAYGHVRDGEITTVDLRDDDGPVAEIMQAATEAEMAYAEMSRLCTKPSLDRWIEARLTLRKIASRHVYAREER